MDFKCHGRRKNKPPTDGHSFQAAITSGLIHPRSAATFVFMKALISLLLAGVLTAISAGAETGGKNPPIKVEQAAGKIAAGVPVLDVRTKEEWDEGPL
jgi:hypothetical protein